LRPIQILEDANSNMDVERLRMSGSILMAPCLNSINYPIRFNRFWSVIPLAVGCPGPPSILEPRHHPTSDGAAIFFCSRRATPSHPRATSEFPPTDASNLLVSSPLQKEDIDLCTKIRTHILQWQRIPTWGTGTRARHNEGLQMNKWSSGTECLLMRYKFWKVVSPWKCHSEE